ncbi:unnamed protein product [Angiostrongylus costaricensis]|uniref:Hydrocephalus-inducing protein homolog n=1 Tax=Angiostrongylus costaricensis TaxID=334426 RepID=A0A0R3PTQ5_ANGCS|nr:unnamed protein product [Angiostrongylus costaricensis]
MMIRLPLDNSSECGLTTDETSGEYSIKLLISPVDGLLVDGFTALSVRCIYSTQELTLTLPPGPSGLPVLHIHGPQLDDGVITGNGVAPLLSMQILDGHGINGPPLVRASVGQRITLDLVLKNTGEKNLKFVFQLSRAIDVPVFVTEPNDHGAKHVYLHM